MLANHTRDAAQLKTVTKLHFKRGIVAELRGNSLSSMEIVRLNVVHAVKNNDAKSALECGGRGALENIWKST